MTAATSPALRLAPECVAVPGDGVLHMLTRRGSFDLRGKDVQRLHERLAPFLAGTHTEAELLAAVPPAAAAAVKGYLAQLRSMGALHEGTTPHAAALDALGAARPALRLRAGELRVRAALDGVPPARGAGLRLGFVPPETAGRLLLRFGMAGRRPARLTCVVVDSHAPPSAAELERRAAYARWLLRNEVNVRSHEPRIQLFRLDARSGELERMALAEPADDGALLSLAEQLRLVRPASVDQIPLVIAEASHPLFAHSATACGIAYPEVRDHLLRVFVARALLAADEPGARGFRAGQAGAPRASYLPATVPPRVAAQAVIAGSWAELQLALLEAAADAAFDSATVAWEEVDLLASPPGEHAASAYLRGILRLRIPRLAARVATTREGLVVCECGAHRARSLVREKAVADLLLARVRETFYPDDARQGGGGRAPAGWGHGDFAPPAELRQIVLQCAAAFTRAPRVAVRRLRAWGTTAWAGVVLEDAR